MIHPIHAPRINNNDDEVQLVELSVSLNDSVTAGQHIAVVETSKASVDIEAEREGYVIRIDAEVSDFVAVGSILIWLGDSLEDVAPEVKRLDDVTIKGAGKATAKAAILLKRHGLRAGDIPAAGDRLTVADIEDFLVSQPTPATQRIPLPRLGKPIAAGTSKSMNAVEKGMVSTVAWHRDEAVPGYIELLVDSTSWTKTADAYAREHGLMMSPLLGLLTYALVAIAREVPSINSTIHDSQFYRYDHVNVGFTVQADDRLYLAVLHEAEDLSVEDFLSRMGELQRRAFSHRLDSRETEGATVSFSSMARWGVSRHIPILPPHTSLMVAHAAPASEQMVLGASYDHRVLSGAGVTKLLHTMSKPFAV